MTQTLIMTGMHRSGTSLIASIIARAGVDIGDRLMPPAESNPHGFFEDTDFTQLHESMLHSRGQSIMVNRRFNLEPTATEVSYARRLIMNRGERPLWGWKDPRTCLFLDLWHEQLPDAGYLLVYRNPCDVLLSLMRRGEPYMPGLVEALEAWYTYNQRIQDFATAHPARCVICHIAGFLGAPMQVAKVLAERVGIQISLDLADIQANYHPDELRGYQLTAADVALLADIHPDAIALYQQLEQSADLPGPSDSAWAVPITQQTPLPMVERRVQLIGLCARLDPQVTESFFARGDRDIHTLEHKVAIAHASAVRLDGELRAAWAAHAKAEHYARSLEIAFRDAQSYARSLEHAAGEAERYARSLEMELERLRSGQADSE